MQTATARRENLLCVQFQPQIEALIITLAEKTPRDRQCVSLTAAICSSMFKTYATGLSLALPGERCKHLITEKQVKLQRPQTFLL